MFCISMYSEGINTKLLQHYMTKCSYMLKLIIFSSWLYIPDFCMFCINMYSEDINTNYTSTIRPSVHLEIDHFFIMVIYTGFPYVLHFHVQ